MRWLLLALLLAAPVLAHHASDSYVAIFAKEAEKRGQISVALRDLDYVLKIDSDEDGEVTDAEFAAGRPKIIEYVYGRITLETDGARAEFAHRDLLIEEHATGYYAALLFAIERAAGSDWVMTYQLLFDADPNHKGLFRIEHAGGTETGVFSAGEPTQRFVMSAPAKGARLDHFIKEGVWHIWIGFDHVLFLIALLLPSVLRREAGQWQVIGSAREAFWRVFKVVTAFTVAHSITLSAATLGWIQLPSRWVEVVVAASVVLAALNNIRVIFPDRGWLVAFAFGLIHGFGFATVLGELGLEAASLLPALLGFNVGVELGQLAIVAVFVPIAFWLRAKPAYQPLILRGGSVAIAAIAALWMFERLFALEFMPF